MGTSFRCWRFTNKGNTFCSQKADQPPGTWKFNSFNQFKVAQRMAQEATRLLKEYDIPVNIESVKEPANKAVGTGTGLW